MKPSIFIGALLILVGIVILIFQGIPFTKKNTADIGPIKLEEKHQETVAVSPIIGAVSLVGGIVLVAIGSRK